MRLLFALGIYTGLRLGDCCTLRWCETDLHRGIITRIPNKTARYNPRPVILPIHPTLAAMLSEIPTQDRGDYVLPKMAEDYRKDVNKVTNVIQGHFQTCGIHTHKTGSGENGKRAIVEVGFHSLRHSFVSMCRASNVPLSVVESLVGHGNPAMTRLYTHTGEVAASRAIACLPAVMGDATPTPTKPAPEAILREARAIAESITVSTWEQARAALLALLPI